MLGRGGRRLGEMTCANLLSKRKGAQCRANAKFPLERLDAPVELAQRSGAVAGFVVHPHNLLMCALACRVVLKDTSSILCSCQIALTGLAIIHKLIEHEQ